MEEDRQRLDKLANELAIKNAPQSVTDSGNAIGIGSLVAGKLKFVLRPCNGRPGAGFSPSPRTFF